jgi:quinoprotein glucose dehydrogenase
MKCALLLAISAFSALAQTVNPTVTNARIDRAFVVTRFADRQYVESPIALSMDESGALFVAEARRFHRGVEDTRSKSFWMMDELAIQSTADRLAQYEKWTAAGKFTPDHFTNTADRIVKIRDSDGDGTADVRSMFSDSFHEPLDGNGASVLVRDGKVYYANIPHIWLLEDADDDGIADSRR